MAIAPNDAADNVSGNNVTDKIVALGGFPIRRTTSAALVPLLQQKMQNQVALFFANTNFIVKCQAHQADMSGDDTVIVNDGIGVDIATWLVHRHTFIENLNGTDFTPLFLQSLGGTARVFLIGANQVSLSELRTNCRVIIKSMWLVCAMVTMKQKITKHLLLQ